MNTPTQFPYHTVKAIQLLTDGFKDELAVHVSQSDAFQELLLDLVGAFVDKHLHVIVDDDVKDEIRFKLLETLKLTAK